MLQLIYFILIAYGLTQVLCYGSILNPIRPKDIGEGDDERLLSLGLISAAVR